MHKRLIGLCHIVSNLFHVAGKKHYRLANRIRTSFNLTSHTFFVEWKVMNLRSKRHVAIVTDASRVNGKINCAQLNLSTQVWSLPCAVLHD